MTIESLDEVLDSIHRHYFEGKIDKICFNSLKSVIEIEKRIMIHNMRAEGKSDESAS